MVTPGPSGQPPDPLRILETVWSDAEQHGFAGWDPYDGLNSRIFRATPLFGVPVMRQAWIQFIKRSPMNLRPVFGQAPEVLAKGVALFALGAWRLSRLDRPGAHLWRQRAEDLLARLEILRSPGWEETCWGYPYDWQSRAFFQPRNAPNLICSVFGAMAFERRTDGGDAATVSADVARFILRHLKREKDGALWITYTPSTGTQVHNVNMLGAALLARVARGGAWPPAARGGEGAAEGPSSGQELPGDGALADIARRAMRFSVERLRGDGSWPYGEAENQGWVDNFHTGYNLSALEDYRRTTGETWMDAALEKAWRFWNDRFLREDGAPAYYADRHWPEDIHCAAQAILTCLDMTRLDPDASARARRTAAWTLRHLWDGRRHFIFQRTPLYVNRVPQIRWGQAWMFWALAELEAAGSPADNHRGIRALPSGV